MKKIYVNEKWCLGCHLCEYYCSFAGTNEKDMARALKNIKINPKIKIEERNGVSFAVSCRHCREPLCVKGCIIGALTISDGVITINKDKCVSCYTCILSCPYGAVSPSSDGAVQKCELCVKTVAGTPAFCLPLTHKKEYDKIKIKKKSRSEWEDTKNIKE